MWKKLLKQKKEKAQKVQNNRKSDDADPLPALIHVTHQKAGSQWIHRILRDAFPGEVIRPQLNSAHFTQSKVEQGKIYPTVYLTKDEFDQANLPPQWYRFVIVRDLRDTMVSAYFSIKFSHPTVGEIETWRKMLNDMSEEDGMFWVLEKWLPRVASIQYSWWKSGERLIRYEDLLRNDVGVLKQIIIDEAGWPITPEELEKIVIANRFENITGRQKGVEDIKAHERKGISGDWQNHFTPQVKDAFKALYGGLLVALGYDDDLSW
jgi:lipopolysaccharide transport system ATP-binding protein